MQRRGREPGLDPVNVELLTHTSAESSFSFLPQRLNKVCVHCSSVHVVYFVFETEKF